MYQSNPRLGNGRRKQLIGKVASRAMARKGYTGGVSKFGKLANAGKQTRGIRPFKGAGGRTPGARPGGYQNFLDGLLGPGEGYGPGGNGAGVNTAPIQAALPESYTAPVHNTLTPQQDAIQAGDYQAGQQYTTADPTQDYVASGGTSQDPAVQNAYNWGVNYAAQFDGSAQASALGGTGDGLFAPTGDVGLAGTSTLSQSAPSAPITAPGGLIPLGGGRYYDPETDSIRGGIGGRVQ